MFSMCSKLTPRARIPDTRIPQLMQPCNSGAPKPSHRGLPSLYLEANGPHLSIQDAQFYLKGTRATFECVTDHYALVSLSKKPLHELPVHLVQFWLSDRRCS